MAYDNIRIVGQHGHIYDDSGYIHMNIEASFIVFQPKKGQKVLVRFTVPSLGRCCYREWLTVLLSFVACLGLAVIFLNRSQGKSLTIPVLTKNDIQYSPFM